MNRTSKPERQKIQILITWKLLSWSVRNFYRGYATWMSLSGWSHWSPNKSNMADGGHLEFWDSRLDIDLWTKVGGRYIAAMRRWPCDRKSKPEVNSHDVIKWMMGTKGCQSQWPWPIFEPNLVQRSNTVLLRWWNVPNSHNLKIQTGGGRHLECRKNVNNPGLDKDAYTKFGRKMHHNHAEMTTWPKVKTGSLFIWRHQMNAGNKRVSISVSITYIWTKFGTELNCHTF